MLARRSFSGIRRWPRCVVASLAPLRSPPMMPRFYSRSLAARPCPGTKSAAPASSWPSPPALGPARSPSRCNATTIPSGAPAGATSGRGSPACWSRPGDRAARPGFPPLQRAQVVALACLEPVAEGLHLTHWSSADLARRAVADGIVAALSPRTVRQILHEVDLQPHRTRYWKTARLDAQFQERAEKVLWCYANAPRLAERGIWVVCADEIPNFQVLERHPIRRAVPGSIEQQEFEYTRHGTVNLLLFLVVHSGRMEVAVEAKKDAEHYIRELEAFRRRHRALQGVFLIQDGDPSHTSGDTQAYWSGGSGWWRPRFTPAHASWLDQAELLVGAFGSRYLRRTSWASREEFIEHVSASAPEYNQLYAHPFEWTWTNHKMRQWFAKHAQ
jgi:DDE superfamily endonuclease